MSDDPNIPVQPDSAEAPAGSSAAGLHALEAEAAADFGAPDDEAATTPAKPIPTEPTSAEAPQADSPPAAGSTPGEAWDEVVDALGDLADAITSWAKAAADTPENRKHIDEVRAGVNDMARQASDAFASVSSSDFGRQVADSATRAGTTIGETAQEFGQAAAPHVATAFAGLADAFGRAAQKVGEAASPPKAPNPDAREAPEPPQAEATPMPPATPEPEDSGEHPA